MTPFPQNVNAIDKKGMNEKIEFSLKTLFSVVAHRSCMQSLSVFSYFFLFLPFFFSACQWGFHNVLRFDFAHPCCETLQFVHWFSPQPWDIATRKKILKIDWSLHVEALHQGHLKIRSLKKVKWLEFSVICFGLSEVLVLLTILTCLLLLFPSLVC